MKSVSAEVPQVNLELQFSDENCIEAPGVDTSGSLFKKYFLETHLPEAIPVFQKIYENDEFLHEIYKTLIEGAEKLQGSSGERDTEGELIDPILKKLGWDFEHRKPISGGVVDYVLYKHSGDRQSANDKNRFEKATAILEAKDLGTDFEKNRGDETPEQQINRYLKDLEDERGDVDWGLLTDGLKWKIFTKNDFHLRRSFTIDFTKMSLEDQDFDRWRSTLVIFTYFFHSDAYKTEEEPLGTTRLDHALEEGKNYEERVQESIKEQVFSEVFPHIAWGIFNGIKDADYVIDHYDIQGGKKSARVIIQEFLEGTGDEREYDRLMSIVRRNTNVMLFRLLFLIYAEDRYLLPMDNLKYRKDVSFKHLQLEIENNLKDHPDFYIDDDQLRIWADLKYLFQKIETGAEHCDLPQYNGGLFDSEEHPVYSEINIEDQYLAPAIDHLARDHREDSPQRINWRDMNERQLGSLYEGLLEYKVQLTKEECKFKYPTTPVSEQKVEKLSPGQLYWEYERDERKETGSYYTPDFVVKYIVGNTVGEKIKEIEENFEKKVEELADSETVTESALEELREIDPATQILQLDVLDPAMGSGHFLVEAVNVLSSGILNVISPGSEAKDNEEELESGQKLLLHYDSPIQDRIEEERDQIIKNVEDQGLDPGNFESQLTRENLVRRLVMKQCVFGVDINPLAVELSKLSLWLNSFTVGAPLSFLDHHLRVGNSLVGTTKKEFMKKIGRAEDNDVEDEESIQIEMTFQTEDQIAETIEESLQNLIRVSNRSDASINQVKSSKDDYREASRDLLPYKKLLDFSLLEHFGDEEVPEALDRRLGELWEIVQEEDDLSDIDVNEKIKKLEQSRQRSYDRHKFFHWDLEFPEIFYDESGKEKENMGFDAVIGNPPWGFEFNQNESCYLKRKFRVIIDRMTDSFQYFFKRCTEILNGHGTHSMIIPNTFLTQSDFEKLRKFTLQKLQLSKIVNLGDGVFEKAKVTTPTCIYHVKGENEADQNKIKVKNLKGLNNEVRAQKLENNQYEEIPADFYKETLKSSFISDEFENIKLIRNIDKKFPGLKKSLKGDINRGISADLLEAFVVNEEDLKQWDIEDKLLVPVIEGNDVHRFHLSNKEKFVLYLTRNTKIDDYPECKKFLTQYKDQITCSEVRDGKHPWFSLHRPRDSEIFEGPKIVGLTTSDSIKVAVDFEDHYTMDSTYVLRLNSDKKNKYQVTQAIMNSKIFNFIYQFFAQEKGRILPQVKATYLEQVPFPKYEQYLSKKSLRNLVDSSHQMENKINERLNLLKQMNPFKYFSRTANMESFEIIFSEYKKGAEIIDSMLDPTRDKHDIDGLRLRRKNKKEVVVEAKIKLRDPNNWGEWKKTGTNIARKWAPIYKMNLEPEKAIYYEQALEVLNEFEEFTSFPGGKTKTILEGLYQTKLPVFDPKEDLQDLIELKQDIQQAEQKIKELDDLINQIVYRLYELTDEEIEIVEKSFKS